MTQPLHNSKLNRANGSIALQAIRLALKNKREALGYMTRLVMVRSRAIAGNLFRSPVYVKGAKGTSDFPWVGIVSSGKMS